ncbi:AAA family ATPase [Tepidibacillus marianensis]|uniref:AAA family ATPase n=1 Tax=Tepidibacillus marianensis TaxID=3131995 RepID=UPI0030D49E51
MYLKSIELSGFKSFADRTELEFVPGIAAVVGPNGSGKSNITDAIRWVLGNKAQSLCVVQKWRISFLLEVIQESLSTMVRYRLH